MRQESTSITFRADMAVLSKEFDEIKAAGRFIGKRVAPIIEVGEKSGSFPIFNRETFKKPASSTSRTPDGAYNRITGEFGRGTYDCVEHGLEYLIDDAKRRQYASLFNAERAATQVLTYQMLLAYEQRVAALLSGGGFSSNSPSTVWSTTASAVPLTDIESGIETLQDNCGVAREDISFVIPRADYTEMMATAQVIDKVKYTWAGTANGVQPSRLPEQLIAAMLGIKEVLIAGGSYDSTEEGYAESMSQIWTAGTTYLIVTANEGDSMETPSAARTALWTADSPVIPTFESYRKDEIRSDVLRMRENTEEFLQGETDLFVYLLTT